MNCRDIETLLLAERDGVLTTEQHASLERHVATCPSCQQMRSRLAEAMAVFRTDAAKVTVPNVDEEWQKLRAQLQGKTNKPSKKRPLAPVIWLSAPLAAAAALAFAYFGINQESKTPSPVAASVPVEVAQAEFVEAGDANASTMVYVDKESGWLVVWASDSDMATKG